MFTHTRVRTCTQAKRQRRRTVYHWQCRCGFMFVFKVHLTSVSIPLSLFAYGHKLSEIPFPSNPSVLFLFSNFVAVSTPPPAASSFLYFFESVFPIQLASTLSLNILFVKRRKTNGAVKSKQSSFVFYVSFLYKISNDKRIFMTNLFI